MNGRNKQSLRLFRAHRRNWSADAMGAVASLATVFTVIPLTTLGLGWGWATVTSVYFVIALVLWSVVAGMWIDNITRPRVLGYLRLTRNNTVELEELNHD